MSGRWKPLIVVVPTALLFAVLIGPTLFAPAGHVPTFVDSDFWLYYHPMAEMAFGMLREGRLPLWNPYLYSGMPLLASIEIGVLYPPNWLHLVVSTDRAFCLLNVFHVLLAGVGTWVYVRGRGRSVASALFSATAFASGAPLWLHLNAGMVTVVYSAAWYPLIFALVDRCLRRRTLRSAFPLSLSLACQFLAGFPMFTLLLAGLIPVYLLVFGVDWSAVWGRENLRLTVRFAAAGALALGLVLPQMLPTFRYLGQSVRSELSYREATHAYFPAVNLLTFAVPDFFGDDYECLYWGQMFLCDVNGFCGITTLLLALIAALKVRSREFWFWTIAGVLVAAVALGRDSYVYDLCFLFVPWVDRFRAVSRLMFFADLALAVLAGIGLEHVLSGERDTALKRLCRIGAAAAFVAVVTGVALWITSTNAPPGLWQSFVDWVRRPGGEFYEQIAGEAHRRALKDGYSLMLRSGVFQSTVFLAACALILLSSRLPSDPRLVGVGLLSLLGLELGTFGASFVVLTDTTEWRSIARSVKQALPRETAPFRVAGFSEDPPLALNRLLYERLESVGGHENFVLARYGAFLRRWIAIEPQWQTYLTVPNSGRTYDLLNVKYYVCPPDVGERDSKDELIRERVFQYGGRDFALYRNWNVLPRVNLVHQAHRSHNLQSSIDRLGRLDKGTFRFDSVIEGEPGVALKPISAAERKRERVELVEYAPGRCVANVDCVAPGLVIFIENFAPGWQATIDGKPARVLPANMFMVGVPITAGRHRVTLEFGSRPFVWGCIFALLSMTVMAGSCLAPLCVDRDGRWRARSFRWRR